MNSAFLGTSNDPDDNDRDSETAEAPAAPPAPPPTPIMKFFAYSHLPLHLQEISKPFCELAEWIEATIPGSAEKTVALRKLLESKDAGVRAALS